MDNCHTLAELGVGERERDHAGYIGERRRTRGMMYAMTAFRFLNFHSCQKRTEY